MCSMYMYVCIIYIYIYVYIRTHIHTYIHTYIRTYVRTYIHTYIHKYIHTYIHTYTHTYTYIYIYIYGPILFATTVVAKNYKQDSGRVMISSSFESPATSTTPARSKANEGQLSMMFCVFSERLPIAYMHESMGTSGRNYWTSSGRE